MNFNNKKRTIKIKEKARQSNWTISFAIQIKDENKCKITRNSKTSNIVSYFYIFIQCFLSFNICSLFSPIHTYYVNSYVFTYNAFCVTLYSISVSEMIFFFFCEKIIYLCEWEYLCEMSSICRFFALKENTVNKIQSRTIATFYCISLFCLSFCFVCFSQKQNWVAYCIDKVSIGNKCS